MAEAVCCIITLLLFTGGSTASRRKFYLSEQRSLLIQTTGTAVEVGAEVEAKRKKSIYV
ncbi:MAG TPA: hypothetical protein VF026_03495 [Ktedonobacteraceae bacterium]